MTAEQDIQPEEEIEVLEETDMDDQEEEAAKKEIPEGEELRILEALLFASAEPISPQLMLQHLPEGADLNVLLPELQARYSEGGIELVEIGGQWALRTAKDVGDYLVIEKQVSKKMSRAALETMAIIAYHQPITRAEIENIRGVATHRGTLDILMEMGWVKPGRRRETPGRPLTWVTTNEFLDHFQLESVVDLPGLDDLKASGLLDRRPAIDTLPDTGDLFDDADTDAEEVLSDAQSDLSDEDAYDEATYKEMLKENDEENNNLDEDEAEQKEGDA